MSEKTTNMEEKDNVSREELLLLHQALMLKHNMTDGELLSSDEDSVDTDASDVVITKSAGSVQQIKGLFSHTDKDEEESEQAMPRSEQVSCDDKVSRSEQVSCDDKAKTGLEETNHDKGQTGAGDQAEPNSQQSGRAKCNQNGNPNNHWFDVEQDQHDQRRWDNEEKMSEDDETNASDRKRKLTHQSDDSASPNNCENKSVNNAIRDQSKVFPVFCKQSADARERKDIKETPKKMRVKRKRVKTAKGEEPTSGNDPTSSVEDILLQCEANLQVMDVKTVLKYVTSVNGKIAQMKQNQATELAAFKQELRKTTEEQIKKKMDSVKKNMELDFNKVIQQYEREIKDLQKDLKHQKTKVAIMAGVLQHNHSVIQDISRRLSNTELNNFKRYAVLTGLSFDEGKEECLYQIQQFFDEALGETVELEDCYKIGAKSTVIIFESVKDRNRIFTTKENLKHFQGEDGEGIYLNPYLPADINEKRRRERDIKKGIKEDPEDKTKWEHTKKGFKVGPNIYRKKVVAPDPSDILELCPEELDRILSLDVIKGQIKKIEDSALVPYIADVRNHQEIREIYLKIKLLHAKAKHIVCAYHLPGKEKHIQQDYVDDEEHGVGRRLLGILQANNIMNKAIFIARFGGNIKLEEGRLRSYEEAALKTFEMNNFNAILDKHQPIVNIPKWNATEKKEKSGKDRQKMEAHGSKRKIYNVRTYNMRGRQKNHSTRSQQRADVD